MSYHHLNTFERPYIEILSKLGYWVRQIAKPLNPHYSAIACEHKRNKQWVYRVEQEQELAEKRRLSSHS